MKCTDRCRRDQTRPENLGLARYFGNSGFSLRFPDSCRRADIVLHPLADWHAAFAKTEPRKLQTDPPFSAIWFSRRVRKRALSMATEKLDRVGRRRTEAEASVGRPRIEEFLSL